MSLRSAPLDACGSAFSPLRLLGMPTGPLIVEALRPLTDAPLDTHLMIVEPEQRVGEP